jgi:hypothetical protein
MLVTCNVSFPQLTPLVSCFALYRMHLPVKLNTPRPLEGLPSSRCILIQPPLRRTDHPVNGNLTALPVQPRSNTHPSQSYIDPIYQPVRQNCFLTLYFRESRPPLRNILRSFHQINPLPRFQSLHPAFPLPSHLLIPYRKPNSSLLARLLGI